MSDHIDPDDRVVAFDQNFIRRAPGERVVPNNLEAERSILGAVLLHNETLPIASAAIVPGDFFREAHAEIFRTMLRLHARHEAIDLVTLRHALTQNGQLDAVGGPAYISSLVDGVPRSTNVGAYCGIVRDLAIRRRLVHAATKALNAAMDHELDTAQIADIAQTDFATVARDGSSSGGLDAAFLSDAVDVIAQGQQIAKDGVRYVVDGLIPSYGMVGFLVAFAKTGKSTFGQALAAAVATGRPFLDRPTTQTRVLIIASEDPPEWVAFLARMLTVDKDQLLFYRAPVVLDRAGLQAISQTIRDGGFGLVLISSWQAVVSSLLEGENDNIGAVRVVSAVKAAALKTGIPWLIDAHSGKGENQDDDADPMQALRGASSAAGAADYLLSLRYADGAFGTKRRLSGKGRFVSLAPLTMDFDPATGIYTNLGGTKVAAVESTWKQIREMGVLDHTPRSLTDIARKAGIIGEADQLSGQQRKRMFAALNRDEVGKVEVIPPGGGKKTTLFHLLEVH